MSAPSVHDWPQAPADWPVDLRQEFAERAGIGQVGKRLVSETDRVRIWHLDLQPGERIGFHTHVLDYFWTALTAGTARSRYHDGRVVQVSYLAGDTRHHRYGLGEFMIHDLENIGTSELVFTTVEFLDSANAPLPVAIGTAGKTA